MPRIRTTMQPGEVIEVTDKELLDLTRMGLVHSSDDKGSGYQPVAPKTEQRQKPHVTGAKAPDTEGKE